MRAADLGENAGIQRALANTYSRAHNIMRNVDGLQPQEAFDELLKCLFVKQCAEDADMPLPKIAKIRQQFAQSLESHNSWSNELWRDRKFHLSDSCLQQCSDLFRNVQFSSIDCDIRSAALREFLGPEVRKGLGIYLTPDEVVREVVRFVDPHRGSRCLDPACGSGTFLIEILRHWRAKETKRAEVWGADKNPRMLLIAELNLGHFKQTAFSRTLMDSLTEPHDKHRKQWCRPGFFDFVFTNPPFGVTIKSDNPEYRGYETAHDAFGLPRAKQASEWLFVEQCLHWLRPGGTLAIVLPRSVLTNPSEEFERRAVNKLGFLRALITLPPETFYATGTQTNAVVAIIQKYRGPFEASESRPITIANVTNVGFDTTGRLREGNQLPNLGFRMRDGTERNDVISTVPDVKGANSLDVLTATSVAKRRGASGVRLGDICQLIKTGRTPPRAAYHDSQGLFLVKVGNLTGYGISWIPRDRNYIDKNRFKSAPLLKSGDIVLTSSAHSPVYIGKKVDIVTDIPAWVGGAASFVGEVMLLRADQEKISPFVLLGFLRQPTVNAEIREMVRGQTAHLYPDDIAELRLPEPLLAGSSEWETLSAILREETSLNWRLNELARKQMELFREMAATLN